jgi:hypothetical protein
VGACPRTAIAAVCVGALTLVTPPAHAAFPGQNGRIAFTTARDAGNLEIYTMDADGSGLVNLTNSAAYEDSPGGSSDGLKVVFSSQRDGEADERPRLGDLPHLVPGRHEDRVRKRPRREHGDLHDERRRHRPGEDHQAGWPI